MTRSGAWRSGGGRPADAPEVVAPEVVAPEVVAPEVVVPEVVVPEVVVPEVVGPEVSDFEEVEPVESDLDDGAIAGDPSVPMCIFCNRPSGTAEYAWPEWLCRFLMDQHVDEAAMLGKPGPDLMVLERMEKEIDKTVTCVCATCWNGWIMRLEDNVSGLLRSMIAGEPTALPPARRKMLARWAAKTAIVMECATRTWVRTPRFAAEHIRKVGVHPGTQVLIGRYDGSVHGLTYERDLFSRMVDDEKRYVAQTSFVIGKLIIQVFADPWRDNTPELTDQTAHPFIPLLGGNGRVVEWPPSIVVDDELYALARCGPISEAALAPRKANLQST